MAPTASRSSSRKRGAAGPAATDIQTALQELLALDGTGGWVVSCYQKLEPGDRAGENGHYCDQQISSNQPGNIIMAFNEIEYFSDWNK